MIDRSSTLADVCFAVSAALNAHGMTAVLTGGSAAAFYAPQTYMSYDADFILSGNEPLREVAAALAPIGFERYGRSRIFTHPKSEFTVDFPKGPLAVGRDYTPPIASAMVSRIFTIGRTTSLSKPPWASPYKAPTKLTWRPFAPGRNANHRNSSPSSPSSNDA